MAIRRFKDFVLVADDVRRKEGKGAVEEFTVQVFDSPVGQGEKKEQVKVPDLAQELRFLEDRTFDDKVQKQIELGQLLADLLLPDYARKLFSESLMSLRNDEGLRLRLRLDDALADFPWEYMYIQDTRGEKVPSSFLALDPRISIVRHEALARPPDRFSVAGDIPEAPARRRVVVAMATPPSYPRLTNLPSEQKAIRQALAKVREIEVTCVPNYTADHYDQIPSATLEDVSLAMRRQSDIFHFSGHGEFDEDLGPALRSTIGAGSIVLVNASGEALPVAADTLAQVLQGRGVRLVVLGACETARRDGRNVWSGVAAALLRVGIPAVVAMQFKVRDELAAAFSGTLYEALVEGRDVDEAVGLGRAAIRIKTVQNKEPDLRDWGGPVFYLRADRAFIFPAIAGPAFEYFTNFVRQWGVPKGVGLLTEEQARSRQSTYKFTYEFSSLRGHLVRHVQIVNGLGNLTVQGAADPYIHLPEDPANLTFQECQLDFFYDESTNLDYEVVLNKYGRSVLQRTYDHTRDRRNTTVNYQPEAGEIGQAPVGSGANVERIARSEVGFDVELTYFDSAGKPKPDAQGSFGELREVNTQGLPWRITTLGRQREPRSCKQGYCIVEVSYDDDGQGNRKSQTYFAADRRPALHSDGYHIVEFSYDNGNLSTVRFLGLDGQSTVTRSGFGSWHATHDEHGNIRELKYTDSKGNPVIVKKGYASWKANYDTKGNLSGMDYLDADGKPTSDVNGVSKWKASYDNLGNQYKMEYLDSDGRPTRNEDGIARWEVRQFDEFGNIKEVLFFGPDGRPTRNRDWVGGWKASYNPRGKQIEQTYLDLSGQPTRNKDGIARWTASYDGFGNQTGLAYFGPDNQPTEDNNGFYRWRYDYDDQGNCVERVFDLKEKPARRQGYSGRRMEYDEFSNMIREIFLNAEQKPTLHLDGYTEIQRKYDERGNALESTFHGADDRLVLTRQGYARWTAKYDERGNRKEMSFFGIDDKPAVDNQTGAARWVAEYDERDNLTKKSYFDADGSLTLAGENGVAGFTAAYDPRGNQIEVTYFGSDEKPANNNRDVAKWKARYNERGNKVEQTYFGIDGNPSTRSDGSAKVTCEYDDRSNQIAETHCGLGTNAVVIDAGYAKWTAAYDDRDNCTEKAFFAADDTPARMAFFAPDGTPVRGRDGFVKWTAEYDERGNQFKQVFVTEANTPGLSRIARCDARGNQIEEKWLMEDGALLQRWTKLYDEQGNQTLEAWFGRDGKAETRITELERFGGSTYDIEHSSWTAQYDPRANQIERTFFDGTGAVLLKVVRHYDSGGNLTEELFLEPCNGGQKRTSTSFKEGHRVQEISLLDPDNQPTTDQYGRVEWTQEFDQRGNRTEFAYFDADGNPAVYKGHIKSTARYDEWDNLIDATYHIPRGELELLYKTFKFGPGRPCRASFEASASPAGDVKSEYEALLLRYQMAENEDQSYHLAVDQIETESVGPPRHQFVERKMTQRATGVNKDGSFNILLTVEPARKAPDDQQQAAGAQTLTAMMSRSGKILGSSLGSSAPDPLPFPTHPIFVGETWEAESRVSVRDPFSGKPLDRRINYLYMLVDITTVKTLRCAHIKVLVSPREILLGPGTSLRISGQGETYFSYEEGLLVATSVEITTVITAPDTSITSVNRFSVELESGVLKRPGGPASPAALP